MKLHECAIISPSTAADTINVSYAAIHLHNKYYSGIKFLNDLLLVLPLQFSSPLSPVDQCEDKHLITSKATNSAVKEAS